MTDQKIGSSANEVRGDFLRDFSDVQWWHQGVVSDEIQRRGKQSVALPGSNRPGETTASDAVTAYQAPAGFPGEGDRSCRIMGQGSHVSVFLATDRQANRVKSFQPLVSSC